MNSSLKGCFLILISGFLSLSTIAQDRVTGQSFASRSEVIAVNGMVATSQIRVVMVVIRQSGMIRKREFTSAHLNQGKMVRQQDIDIFIIK